jgi:hypothetical protein
MLKILPSSPYHPFIVKKKLIFIIKEWEDEGGCVEALCIALKKKKKGYSSVPHPQ